MTCVITNLSKLCKQDLVNNGLKYLTLRVAKYLAKKEHWERWHGNYWVTDLWFMLLSMELVGREEEERLNHGSYKFIDSLFLFSGFVHEEDVELANQTCKVKMFSKMKKC